VLLLAVIGWDTYKGLKIEMNKRFF